MHFLERLFVGRIARLNYFLGSVIAGLAAWAIVLIVAVLFGRTAGAIALMIIYAILILISFSLVVRRIHDLGWRGWWSFLMLIPFVNLAFGLFILFRRGAQMPNAYGPVPSAAVDLLGSLFPRG